MATLTLTSDRDLAACERPSKTTYRIEPITEADFSSGPLLVEWEALRDRVSPRTPFTSPLWNGLWWKHLRSQRLGTHQELFAHAVRDASGALIAVAPMMVMQRPAVGPLRLRTLCLFGTDPNLTELRSLICAAHDELKAFQALRSYIMRNHSFDWIDWGDLRAHGWQPASQLLPAGKAFSHGHSVDFHLPLPATWEEFRASRPRNIKESIRKCYNSLKRAGHTTSLEVIESPARCEKALRVFFDLHTMRARAADTVAHANVFSSESTRSFLLDYCGQMAQRGALRIFQLRVGPAIVATRIGFLFGDELYLYYSGYDTAWSSYSIMTTLLVEAIRWAIDQRLRLVNLSTGADVSKLRWRPTGTEYRNLVELMPGLRPQLAFAAFRALKRCSGRRGARTAVACCPDGT